MHPYFKAINEAEALRKPLRQAMGLVVMAAVAGWAWGRGLGPWWAWAAWIALLALTVEEPLRATLRRQKALLAERNAHGGSFDVSRN